MTAMDDLKAAVEATYAATADSFDHPALGFRDRFGRGTVERLGLDAGERVLDACCGTGASAIPAAQAVGPTGTVVGIDIAEPALSLARRKALDLGLTNITFRHSDIEQAGLAPDSFDAAVCVFGIFFLPDMVGATRRLAQLLRPGGRLALTVWAPNLFEPGATAFWDSIADERPDLVRGFQPWTRLTDTDSVRSLLDAAGLRESTVETERRWHALSSPDDWCRIVLGTGFRGTLDRLDVDARARTLASNLAWARDRELSAVRTDVIYAIASTGERHGGAVAARG